MPALPNARRGNGKPPNRAKCEPPGAPQACSATGERAGRCSNTPVSYARFRSCRGRGSRAAVDCGRLASEDRRGRPLPWLLRQIEAAVDSARERKLPELRMAMRNYINRFTSLPRQVMAMEASFGISAVGRICDLIKEAEPDRQESLLDALASRFALTRVRLIDPQTLKVEHLALADVPARYSRRRR